MVESAKEIGGEVRELRHFLHSGEIFVSSSNGLYSQFVMLVGALEVANERVEAASLNFILEKRVQPQILKLSLALEVIRNAPSRWAHLITILLDNILIVEDGHG